MESRRALHDHRHKVKNTHATYKPNKGEREDRIKKGRAKHGRGRGPIEDLTPSQYSKGPKTVLTSVCVICAYPFAEPSVICPQCQNCQACGKFNEDRYSNDCPHCGNHVEGPRLDENIPRVGAP